MSSDHWRSSIESAIGDLKKAIEANDSAGMTRAMEALTSAQHKAAESLYSQQQAAGQPAGGSQPGGESAGSSGGGQPADVIDAEVVDEDKK